MRIDVYHESQKDVWDAFIQKSKNGTFLFLRDYMDYHCDRFVDHSILVWDDKDNLIAVLPANQNNTSLISHGGLTYGGFITNDSMKMTTMLSVFESTLNYLKEQKVEKFIYKTIPYIYYRTPAQEDVYALFLCNARIIRAGAMAVVDSRHRLPFQERRNRGIKKAGQAGLVVCQSNDLDSYWQILCDRLLITHNAKPVHGLSEIKLLRSRFPDNIKLFSCYKDYIMLAGVVIYESDQVAHVQYIASNDLGRNLGALDLIFGELINNQYHTKPFFDFSTSDEDGGRFLNKGLIEQKEGFGAKTVVQTHYEIQLSDWESGQYIGAMG